MDFSLPLREIRPDASKSKNIALQQTQDRNYLPNLLCYKKEMLGKGCCLFSSRSSPVSSLPYCNEQLPPLSFCLLIGLHLDFQIALDGIRIARPVLLYPTPEYRIS